MSIPKAAIAARMPFTIPPATSAGMIAEKMPVMISNTRAEPFWSSGCSASAETSPPILSPSMGSNSSYTDPTLAPMITCHCPSLTCAPKAPSSVLRASRSALLTSFRLNLSLLMQCVAITTLSAPPTSSRTRAASSFLSATTITPTQDPRH